MDFLPKCIPLEQPQDGPDLQGGSQQPRRGRGKWAVTGVNASVGSSLWHLKSQLPSSLLEGETREPEILHSPVSLREAIL